MERRNASFTRRARLPIVTPSPLAAGALTSKAAMNVVLLSGSPSVPSRSTLLLSRVQQRLEEIDARCHALPLRELPPQALLHADASHPAVQAALQQVKEAALVVVATPIYKAAYSGLLKAFLDLLPQDGLRGKAVLPLATGGSLGHLLAIDYALKPVLASLGARHIADAVFVPDAQFHRDAEGRLQADEAVLDRLDRALLGLFEPLPRPRVTPPAHREAVVAR
jgi:FMN reductase